MTGRSEGKGRGGRGGAAQAQCSGSGRRLRCGACTACSPRGRGPGGSEGRPRSLASGTWPCRGRRRGRALRPSPRRAVRLPRGPPYSMPTSEAPRERGRSGPPPADTSRGLRTAARRLRALGLSEVRAQAVRPWHSQPRRGVGRPSVPRAPARELPEAARPALPLPTEGSRRRPRRCSGAGSLQIGDAGGKRVTDLFRVFAKVGWFSLRRRRNSAAILRSLQMSGPWAPFKTRLRAPCFRLSFLCVGTCPNDT